jgi:hypothetical protein
MNTNAFTKTRLGYYIWRKRDKIFSVIILDNNSGIIPSNILRFNYSDLANFEKPILIRELDINKYPVFGFAFIESAASNTN